MIQLAVSTFHVLFELYVMDYTMSWIILVDFRFCKQQIRNFVHAISDLLKQERHLDPNFTTDHSRSPRLLSRSADLVLSKENQILRYGFSFDWNWWNSISTEFRVIPSKYYVAYTYVSSEKDISLSIPVIFSRWCKIWVISTFDPSTRFLFLSFYVSSVPNTNGLLLARNAYCLSLNLSVISQISSSALTVALLVFPHT